MKRLGALMVAIGLLAVAAAAGLSGQASRPAGAGLVSALFAFLVGVAVVGAAALIVTAVVALWPEGPVRPREPSLIDLGLRTLVFCLVLLAAVVLGATLLQVRGLGPDVLGGRLAEAERGLAAAQRGSLLWRLASLGVLAAVGALAALALRERRASANALPAGAAAPLAQVLDRLVADLQHGGDPRSRVIAVYAEMVDLFAARGFPAAPSEAPGEYLERVLPAIGLGGLPARRLRSLYELARFSPQPIARDLQRSAAAALRAVREELP